MNGKHSRDKGRRYENEVVGWLNAHGHRANRVSAMYQSGPDIRIHSLDGRYAECRIRKANYESLNQAVIALDGDASLYFTRMDHQTGDHLVVLWATTLLDLINEGPPNAH